MADEPERRVVGALLLELERQRAEALGRENLYVDMIVPDGTLYLNGLVDMFLLARAVIAEIKENPL